MTHLLLALVTAAIVAAQQPAAPAPPVRANLWIDVTAVDRREMPVTDLKPGEFEVWVAGFRIPITDVVAVTPESGESRTIVLILDNGAVPPQLAPRVQEAARLFVNRMTPGDRMAILPLHGGKMDATDDRSKLLRAVDSYHVRGFPFRIEDAGEHVLSTVTAIARQMAELSDRRKTIVAIGTGWLFDTPLPPPGLRDLGPQWIEAMRALASTHTTLYVLDPAGVSVAPCRYFGGTSGFARETGGYAFLNTNDVRGAVDRIWRDASSYYLLGVQNPPVQRAADLREVEIKILRKGVNVRARRAIGGRP